MKQEDKDLYDAVVVGGGPAGLTAALYLARARRRVVVVEKDQFGGNIALTEEVANYPGIERTSGKALTDTMRRQAEVFGAEFMLAEAEGIDYSSPIKLVKTTKGALKTLSVLLAVGSAPRTLGVKGEEAFRGHGVAYCATCDGEFFTGKDVFVIGGGYAAAEESVFLAKYANHVHVLFRKADFSCAPAVADAARAHEKITIHPFTVVDQIAGDTFPRSLRYRNVQTGEVAEYHAPEGDTFGVFVLAGYAPDTAWLKDIIELTPEGNIVVDNHLQTNVEGVFAAGDVCTKELRQIVTATSDGASAATFMEYYLKDQQEKNQRDIGVAQTAICRPREASERK